MTDYSTNPEVNKCVAALIANMARNPYDRTGRAWTIAGIRDVVKTDFGAAEAKANRITVH
jgi:hypothetical protein